MNPSPLPTPLVPRPRRASAKPAQPRSRANRIHLIPACLILLTVTLSTTLGAEKEPVYIGSQACGTCHDGHAMGHQFSKWRLTAHARAYTALALPESREITRLSGLLEEPHQSRMCLGCHATAADSEIWERDPGFHLEDGLQCEACHGPGSEYAPEHIMRDRNLAMQHGLKMPTKDDCMICHRTKGSHDGVLRRKPFDLEAAWLAIAHPSPKPIALPQTPITPVRASRPTSHQFTGVMACSQCHTGPKFNFQFSHWRRSPHARAYATLATPEAYRIAREAGVEEQPQKAAQCLTCHVTGHGFAGAQFQKEFDHRDGVQCESCHGPGSGYSPEAIMLDKAAARANGLWEVSAATCLPCHELAHGKPFDYQQAVQLIAHPSKPPPLAHNEPAYKNPLNLALTPSGHQLWVTCEADSTVSIIDTVTRTVIDEIPVGGQPNDVCFTPCGRRAFVSNRLDDTVSVLDVASRKVIATLPVGDEPHGVLVDRQGKHLYVLNTSTDNISVIDLETLQETKRLSASRSPWSLALSPDGSQIFVTHALSRFIPERTPSMSEITVIRTDRAMVDDRYVVEAANLLQGIDWHPSGEYALTTLLRTKNLVPMTRINRGWTISNGLGILWRDGTIDQVLLDQNDLYFPDPSDVAITPNGKYALVTSSSTHRVAVIDLDQLIALLHNATPHERQRVIPNHLGKSSEFVIAQISTPTTPKGITCSPDSARAYVANMLDDSVTVIDLHTLTATHRIPLSNHTELTRRRRGELLFHDAKITFRRQFSCSSCHPDGHIDNIVYDIEDDGIGMGPIDNRTLRGINDMAPYKWIGINPSLRRQCGPRLAVFITRIHPFNPAQLDDLHYYLCSIPRPPNRYRKLGEDLTDPQRRGKALFFRATKTDGSPIPPGNRCNTCHPPPLYTDGKVHDVGTRFPLDRDSKFDAPHLHNIYDSAPYLHNGIAWTLEEIWTKYNPYDTHGVTNDMTKDELNDLIEYLKTL
jgi:YVTN family beta-propeller protein